MGAPILQGVWWTQTNVPLNDTSTAPLINNSSMHCLKEMLKGTITLSGSSTSSSLRPDSSKWTVIGSCDGVLGALDGVDRLTGSIANSFDNTKWVHAVSGSAHSWIVLKSPDPLGPVYMCIDANAVDTRTWGVTFSREAFVASAPAPMTGSRPITNKAWQLGTSTDPTSTTTSIQLFSDQTLGSLVYRAHISVDASGAFHFLTNRNATGFFNFYTSCFRTVDKFPHDTRYDNFCIMDNNVSAPGSPLWANVAAASTKCNGRSLDGVDISNPGGLCEWKFGSTSFASTAQIDTSGSVSGSFRVFPPYIQTLSAGNMSWRGRIPDCWLVGAIGAGNGFPAAPPAQTHLVCGDLLVPFSLSASL